MSNIHTPVSRRGFLNNAGIAGAAVVTAAASLPALSDDAHADGIPDPIHIRRDGVGGFKLKPTGSDDGDNLEWALRNIDPGATVRLGNGTFKIGHPVVVPDFDGTLKGRGAHRTTITVTDDLSVELWEAPGGGRDRGEPEPPPFPRATVDGAATRTFPAFLQFYKTPLGPGEDPATRATRITLKNFTFRGSCHTERWLQSDSIVCAAIANSFDWNNPESANESTRQDVTIKGMVAEGYRSDFYGPLMTACSCITIVGGIVATSNYDLTGMEGGDAFGAANGGIVAFTPAEGDVTIVSCTFRDCRIGPNVIGYKNGKIKFRDNITEGCLGNCLMVIDVSDCKVTFRDNDLGCDAILLPPELANGATDIPSSLGCTVVLQGLAAVTGIPFNPRFAELAMDVDAHMRPGAGPLGTWRPQGLQTAPQTSRILIKENSCECTEIPNNYGIHLVDAVNALGLGIRTLEVDRISENSCMGCDTCISLEHVDGAVISENDCVGLSVGVELYNAAGTEIDDNDFSFPGGSGCEVLDLAFGDKIDLVRVQPGAGICRGQES